MYETNPGFWGDSETWMWEYIGDDPRIVSIYEGTDLDEADIRHKRFAVDISWHKNNYFWNANQAAFITFGRDPDKVVKREDYVPSDDDEKDFRRHNDLWKQIDERRLLIEDAQRNGVLPEFFPPAMYIDWGKRLGFDIPRFVVSDLEIVNSERMAIDEANVRNTPLGGAQQKRLENNVIKILGAVLIYAKLEKKEPAALSAGLEKVLSEKAIKLADKKLNLSVKTIEERLVEARELLEE
jgi:hypothetical protein